MRLITTLGYMEFFILFLLILTFSIDYKKGFILFQVLLWTGAFTFIGKNYFALPRPFHVDWGPLPADVLEVTRKAEHMEYGFPSGHSSIAIAFWGTLLCLFRQKWLRGICIALMILIPISRIYLGVHFLADVLGGIALGGLCWYIAYLSILKRNKRQAFFERNHFPIAVNVYSFFLLILPLVFLYMLPSRGHLIPAFIIGSRAFVGVGFILKKIAEVAGMEGQVVVDFLRNMLSGLALFWLAVALGIKLGWYRRENRLV